jgi:hypothetical protein
MKGGSDELRKRPESAMQADITENILLRNSILDDDCRRELREINKHELIIKICEILGSSPSDLCKAEEIFEKIKFDIANYVIHHEYESPNGVSTDLLLWLDTKTNPGHFKKLSDFINRFFK